MHKVFEKLDSKHEEEQDDHGLTLKVGEGCLHQINVEKVQMNYAKLLLR